jgi:RluA family pseudouridine synthase
MGDKGGGAYAVVNGLQYVRPYMATSVYRVKKERHQVSRFARVMRLLRSDEQFAV